MRKLSLAVLSALALVTACRNEEQEDAATATMRTVRFIAAPASTRTAFDAPVDGVYRTRWTENDSEVLLSLNYGEAQPSAVTPSSDGTTAAFEAAFDASAATAPYVFYAVSPASAARAISPSRSAWSVYIAAEQTPLENSVDEAAQLLVAKSASSSVLPGEVELHFAHLTAYGRISLKNVALSGAKVLKADLVFGTPVVGEWYWGEDGSLTSNGSSHTVTLNTDASGDLWFACAPVSVGGQTLTVNLYTDKGVLSREIVFPEGLSFTSGKVARFSVDFTGVEAVNDIPCFELVTDDASLLSGDELLIVHVGRDFALGPQVDEGTPHRQREAVSFDGDRLVSYGNATVLKLETGAKPGTWSFRTPSAYLSSAASKNILQESGNKDDYSSWKVSISDGTASISSLAGDSRFIRYNTSSPRFSCYKESVSNMKMVSLYRKVIALRPTEDDPITRFTEYGSYFTAAPRTYVKGSDQISRFYPSPGEVEFAIVNVGKKEQLVVYGYDPGLSKGDLAVVSVQYRRGTDKLLDQDFRLSVVKEDGSKVWLGDGSGQGLIIKK